GTAREATARVRLLELALAHGEAMRREQEARLDLARYPAEMHHLQSDDAKRLADLRRIAEAAAGTAANAGADLERAEEAILRSGFAGGRPEGLIQSLREELRLLGDRTREIESLEQDRESARAGVREVERAFVGATDSERLRHLDLAGMRDLERLSRDAAELGRLRLAEEALLVSGDEAEASSDLALLSDATSRLAEWMRLPGGHATGRSARGPRLVALGALALAVTLSVLLATLVHPGFALFAAASLAVGAWLLLRGRGGTDERGIARARFLELGLEPPTTWAPSEVLVRLREIERERAAAELASERRARSDQAANRLRELETRDEELRARAGDVAAAIGVPLETELSTLHWLVERVVRWQAARDALASAEARLEKSREQFDSRAAKLAALAAAHDEDSSPEVARLRSSVESLDRRLDACREAEQAREKAEEAIRRAGEDARRAASSRAEIHSRLGIETNGEPEVERWSSMLPDFRTAEKALADAATATRIARDALETAESFDPALLERPPEEHERELAEQRRIAARFSALQQGITATQTKIQEARRRHDVELAIAELERVEQKLTEARARDLEAIVRQRLIDYLRTKTRDERRPEVFHRARRWFSIVTRGRCQLEFDDGEPVAFRAIDTASGLGHSLDELSGGTRVQLLLAVRAAFVETQETGHRLPLLLDETLATADDQRASAIIESIVEMARAGRQVFYFTAQRDEVLKWKEALASAAVPFTIHHLGQSPRESPTLEPRELLLDPDPPLVPVPDGHDHDSYGTLLRVPRLDPLTQEVDSVHLWYLIEPLDVLHRCLSIGIDRYGPLRTYLDQGRPESLGDLHRIRDRIDACARALGAFLLGARVGRGRPVDRVTLDDSGAVSERFIDEVSELAEALGGDASLVLERLESGEVTGFRKEKLTQLREFLGESGHLDLRTPLSPDELHSRVAAALAPEIEAGLLQASDLYRLLRRIAGPAAATVDAGRVRR
ncbi:MAG: hypothetical protein WD766_01795, partial [Gemmatimonadota bacterium]